METAKIYFLAVNAVALSTASYLLFVKTLSLHIGECVLITSILSMNFFHSVYFGNAGGVMCAFLVIAWLICDRHQYIAGVLIALSMVKPQDALIVCIFLLMMKRIKPLIIGAVIDISAWLATSVLTGKGMLELVKEFLFMPSEKVGSPFAGIFTILADNFLLAAFMSMAAGIIFVIALYMLLPDEMPEIFKAYPAFMTVTFWCYSSFNDCYVLILPACLCLLLMYWSDSFIRSSFWFLGSMWCSLGFIIASILTRIFMVLNSGLSKDSAYIYAQNLYEFGVIILGVIMCFELRRIYSEAKS